MHRTHRTAPIFAVLIVLLAATGSVPNAQATSIDWVLTDATDTHYLLSVNTQSHGTQDSLRMLEGAWLTWKSYEVADETLDLSGTWSYQLSLSDVVIGFFEDEIHVVIKFGTVSPHNSFTQVAEFRHLIGPSGVDQDGNAVVADTQTVSDLIVPAGDHLGVQVGVEWGSAYLDVTPSDSPAPTSFLQSPDSDPNFPVWELSSLALLGAGLVVVAGVVHTQRRKR